MFRGVKADMPPDVVKKRGGLFPNNADPTSLTADAYRVVYHQKDEKNEFGKNSAYASTSSSLDVAAWFAQPGGYIYVIKSTPNMFPVESTVDSNPLPWEREYTALGGVQFEQIAECFYIPPDAKLNLPEEPQWKLKTQEDVSRNMDSLRDLVKQGALQPRNEELNYDKKFDLQSASPGQPQLAGYIPGDDALEKEQFSHVDPEKPTWRYAKEFMDSIGAGQGWSTRFPLFKNPIHVAAIREQEEKGVEGATKDVAATAESSGVNVQDLLYDMSPVKPFADLVDAIRSEREVSVGEWLGVLGGVSLEILAWAPTPAAVGVRALRFARAGYKASQAIKKGVKAAEGINQVATAGRIRGAIQKADHVSAVLETKLDTVEVKVPSSPSTPPVKQPVGKITKLADKVKVDKVAGQGEQGTSALSPEALEKMLKQLEEIQVPNDPVVPVMMQVVKEAGKKSKKPMPALAERSSPGRERSLADSLQQFAAAKLAAELVPLGALDDILDKVEEKLGLAVGEYQAYDSFLKADGLWLALGTKLSEVAHQPSESAENQNNS